MKISFEAYGADNFVHELPGIILPCNEANEELEDTSQEYIHTLEFKDEEVFIEKFIKWSRKVAQAAWSVGGDDTYFDYYPGNFDAAREIARQFPPIENEVEFMENFAIAVRYGVAGMMDGLNITLDEDEALRRYGSLMGQKLYEAVHTHMDEMQQFGGYWIHRHDYEPKQFKYLDIAKWRNQDAIRRGIPKDLVPYTKKELAYFKRKDQEEPLVD